MIYYVLGFAFTPDEKEVLLLEKKSPSWQAGRLNGIGGKKEQDESFDQAMVREGQEEINLNLPWKRFARLEGEGFCVWCYRTGITYGELSQVPWYNDVGEMIVVRGVNNLRGTIPNLSWLIPMAKRVNEKDWPYNITEHP